MSRFSKSIKKLVLRLLVLALLIFYFIGFVRLHALPTSTISEDSLPLPPTKPRSGAKLHRKVTPVPETAKNTFFLDDPLKTAARLPHVVAHHGALGDIQVQQAHQAHFVWRVAEDTSLYSTLLPFQRHNHMPNRKYWENKSYFDYYMRQYAQRKGRSLPYIPQTYMLHDAQDVQRFRQYLGTAEGQKKAWLFKPSSENIGMGQGIQIWGPHSRPLQHFENSLKENHMHAEEWKYLLQEYICNGLLYQGRHKMDIRMYVLVASIDPLIVLLQPGIGRVAAGVYSERNFDNKSAHITNTSKGAQPISWKEIQQTVRHHYQTHKEMLEQRLNPNGGVFDPAEHVLNQMKSIAADIVEAFKERSFVKGDLSADNGFSYIGYDFYIDNDLDVHILELNRHIRLQHPRGLPNRSYEFLSESIDIVKEIHQKQSLGVAVMPLQAMGSFDVVYDEFNDFRFSYEYQRPVEKSGCIPRV